MTQGSIVLMACGSFSPPTPMHFRMFEIAKDYFHSLGTHSIIGGIVSPVHDAYAKKDLLPAAHRCAMLKLALKSSDWIKHSEWEVNQEGWTRTKQSLQYHQNYMNAYLNDRINNDALDGTVPSWLPDAILKRSTGSTDDVDNGNFAFINNNGQETDHFGRRPSKIRLKLLCGADLLESFSVPGLWADEDLEYILGEHGLVVVSRSGSNPEKFIYDSDVLTRFKRNITIVTNWVPNEVSSTMIRRLLRRGESVKYLIDDTIIAYIKQNQLYGTGTQNIKSFTEFSFSKPPMITPSPSSNDVVMKSPSEFRSFKDDAPKPRNNHISSKIMNYLIGVDEADSNDVYTSSTQSPVNHFKEKRLRLTNKVSTTSDISPKSFCGDPNQNYKESTEDIRATPRKAVKVITDLSGVHKVVGGKKKVCDNDPDFTDEVFLYFNCHPTDAQGKVNGDCLSVDLDKLKIKDEGEKVDGPRSPLRSYDDVVKFIFSEHGIQVLSDRETIV